MKKLLVLLLALVSLFGCKTEAKKTIREWAVDGTKQFFFEEAQMFYAESQVHIMEESFELEDDGEYVTNHVAIFEENNDIYLWVAYIVKVSRFDGDYIWNYYGVSFIWQDEFSFGDTDLDRKPILESQIVDFDLWDLE